MRCPATPPAGTGTDDRTDRARTASRRAGAGRRLGTHPALGRAVLIAGLLLVAAVLLGRVDLIVLATPFALGTAYALRRRPTALPQVWISPGDDGPLVEGGEVTAVVSVGNPDTVDYDLVVLRTRVSPWLRIERAGFAVAGPDDEATSAPEAKPFGVVSPPGGSRRPVVDRPFVTSVPTASAVDLELAGKARRWGRHPVGPAGARVATAAGLLISRAVLTEPVRVRVYPRTEPFEAVEAMPRAAGLVGAHHPVGRARAASWPASGSSPR
ncbi:hypothetical protein GCM10027614_37880 [Micromonospora vulcania]